MAIANLLVQVRTTGANQLRNLSSGFRQASRAGSRATAEMRRDFDRAVVAMNRANGELAEMRREFNRAPSAELARRLHMAALAAQQASRRVDNLADQLRQANRAANSLAGRMGAIAAAAAPLSTLGSGSPLMSGLIAGVVALAPAIAAALQAALVVGLGGAGLGVAIASALQDVDIRRAVTDPLNEVAADLKNFGKQLGPALVQSAADFRRAWRGAAEYVRNLFGDLGTTIVPLTQGLIGMMREAAPGIKQAFATAVPALKELAAMLPGVGKAISSFFSSISDEESTLKGLRLIVMSLAGSLVILGKTIQFLAAWFNFWTSAAEKVYSALGKIPGLGVPFQFLANVLHGINNPVDDLNSNLRVMGGTQLAVAQASRDAAQAMQTLNSQMTAMLSKTMSADEAMLAWANAIRGVSESVKENGKSLDINTEKGNANVTAILAAVAAADRKRQADIDLAGGENAAASAVAAANGTFRQQLDQLAGLMRQLGFTEAQIQSLLGKYYQLANAPNINKQITVTYHTVGDARAAGAVKSGNIAPGGPNLGYASGTPNAPKGWAWVGERGPELINFGGGETVLSARDSAQVARGGRSGSGGVTLVYTGGGGGDALVYRWLNESIRKGRLKVA